MKKKHIVQIGYRFIAYDSISAATAAMATLMKGQKVAYDNKADGIKFLVVDEEDHEDFPITLLTNMPVSVPVKPKPLRLPAPRRNTVECACCENVSVVRGTACPSCGTYAPKGDLF